jgi:AcrR family transcriptional regulator
MIPTLASRRETDDRGGPNRDPRTRRTVARLRDALRTLLQSGSLDEVTVSALCRQAGVHRTTFYGHYASVGEVVADVFTDELDAALDLDDTTGLSTDAIAIRFQDTLVSALGTISADRALYRAALSSASSSLFERSLLTMFRRRVEIALEIWHRHGAALDVHTEIAPLMVAGSLTAVIEAWAESDDEDAGTFADAVRDQMPPWWPRPDGAP